MDHVAVSSFYVNVLNCVHGGRHDVCVHGGRHGAWVHAFRGGGRHGDHRGAHDVHRGGRDVTYPGVRHVCGGHHDVGCDENHGGRRACDDGHRGGCRDVGCDEN